MVNNPKYTQGVNSKTADIIRKTKRLHPNEAKSVQINDLLSSKYQKITAPDLQKYLKKNNKEISEDDIARLYAFIEGTGLWKNVSLRAKDTIKISRTLNTLLNKHFLARMNNESIDTLSSDMYHALSKHPADGPKRNILLALLNFIGNIDFPIEHVYQALTENPGYNAAYKSESYALCLSQTTVLCADIIKHEKNKAQTYIPGVFHQYASSNITEKEDVMSAANIQHLNILLALLKLSKEKYQNLINQHNFPQIKKDTSRAKLAVTQAFIDVLKEPNNTTWAAVFSTQAKHPLWNRSRVNDSNLNQYYNEIQVLFPNLAAYFNLCKHLLRTIKNTLDLKQPDSLTLGKVIDLSVEIQQECFKRGTTSRKILHKNNDKSITSFFDGFFDAISAEALIASRAKLMPDASYIHGLALITAIS